MTANYGPDAPCQRTTGPCVTADPHLGGAHIDPRHPLYDGPEGTIGALPLSIRQSAQTLLRAGAPMPEVVDLAKEIHRLREQVAQVQVDKDRQVQAASERALDCADHGRIIADLEKQSASLDESYRGADAGRVVLVGGYFNLRDILTKLRKQIADGGKSPATDRLLDSIIAVLSEALNDSGRAMDNPPKRRPAQNKLAELAGVTR